MAQWFREHQMTRMSLVPRTHSGRLTTPVTPTLASTDTTNTHVHRIQIRLKTNKTPFSIPWLPRQHHSEEAGSSCRPMDGGHQQLQVVLAWPWRSWVAVEVEVVLIVLRRIKGGLDLRCFNHYPNAGRLQGFCDGHRNLFGEAFLNCGVWQRDRFKSQTQTTGRFFFLSLEYLWSYKTVGFNIHDMPAFSEIILSATARRSPWPVSSRARQVLGKLCRGGSRASRPLLWCIKNTSSQASPWVGWSEELTTVRQS